MKIKICIADYSGLADGVRVTATKFGRKMEGGLVSPWKAGVLEGSWT